MNFSTTRSLRSLESTEPTEGENSLTGKIIGSAIDVHRILGPGLLASAYQACLVYELRLRKLKVEGQKGNTSILQRRHARLRLSSFISNCGSTSE